MANALDGPDGMANALDGPGMGNALDNLDLGMVGLGALPEPDPVERLKTLIEEREDETIEVLKNWIENKPQSVG